MARTFSSAPSLGKAYRTGRQKPTRERNLYKKWLALVGDEEVDFTLLPRNFEYLRQKYEMTDPIFNDYWQAAAASVMTADSGNKRWAKGKAQSKLKVAQERIIRFRASREEMQNVPFDVPTWLPEHKKLLQEAESARARGLGPPEAEYDEKMLKHIKWLIRDLSREKHAMMGSTFAQSRRSDRFNGYWKYKRHNKQLEALEEFRMAWKRRDVEGGGGAAKVKGKTVKSPEEGLLSLAGNSESREKKVQLPEKWTQSSDMVAQDLPADRTGDEPQPATDESRIRHVSSQLRSSLATLDDLFTHESKQPRPVVRYVSAEGQTKILGEHLPIRSRGEGVIRYLADDGTETTNINSEIPNTSPLFWSKQQDEQRKMKERVLPIRPVAVGGNVPGTTSSDMKTMDQNDDPSGYGHPLHRSSKEAGNLFRGLNYVPLERLQSALKDEDRAERGTQRATSAETQRGSCTIKETTTGSFENLLEREAPRSSTLAKESIASLLKNGSAPRPKLNDAKPNHSEEFQLNLRVEEQAERETKGVAPQERRSSPRFSELDTDFYKSVIPPRPTLSDSLRLQTPASGQIRINEDFTVDLNADVPELQSQIPKMQGQLKTSFPRIDSMPYDVSKSNNQKTLQTWLKILVHRWQTRFEERAPTEKTFATPIEEDVKAVLDQMVRDHSLSNEAAERMGSRFNEIFSERSDIRGDAGGSLDWDAFDAEGLTFLRDTTGSKESERASRKANLIQQQKRPGLPRKFGSADFTPFSSSKYSTSSRPPAADEYDISTNPTSSNKPAPSSDKPNPSLPHLTPSGSAHMVSVSDKSHTLRTAVAAGTVHFSNSTSLALIRSNALKKGDVLSVSRIAGIMAAKKCPDLIPLCHPIALTHVSVELGLVKYNKDTPFGAVSVRAKVQCTGPTGVEMEAMTAVMGAALSVVDMCKAVDRGMRVMDVRVVLKEGGRSGVWREEG